MELMLIATIILEIGFGNRCVWWLTSASCNIAGHEFHGMTPNATAKLPRGGFWGDLFSFLGLRSGDANKFLVVGSFNFRCCFEVPWSFMIYLLRSANENSSWWIQLSHPSEKFRAFIVRIMNQTLAALINVYNEQSWTSKTLLTWESKDQPVSWVGIEGRPIHRKFIGGEGRKLSASLITSIPWAAFIPISIPNEK